MYPKTERALRFSFGFFGSLYGIIFLGNGAQIALVLIQSANPSLPDFSGIFLGRTLFFLLVALSHGYVFLKFRHLLYESPRVMEWILHFAFFGQVAMLTILFISGGRNFNSFGAIIATMVYASLLTGVKKLGGEHFIGGAANHTAEPSSPSRAGSP